MLRVLLIRHGQTQWNLERRIMGKEAIGLNETGHAQIKQTAESLKGLAFEALYSSPILRAKESAEYFEKIFGLETKLDLRLEEVGYGDWVGRTFEEVKQDPGYVPYFETPHQSAAPGGESLEKVCQRGRDFLKSVYDFYQEGNVLVVSHADWIKCQALRVLKAPLNNIWRFRLDNASVTVIEKSQQGERLLGLSLLPSWKTYFEYRVAF
ncbi:MAG: histidine phosphatase family protein [Deltaproteobacteria bacterium]|nr:histidine phosphatase family protein [Deltaproteobacteria bacterium]